MAQADPTFVLHESQARAGDVVHFSIARVDDDLTYVIEVEDRTVATGSDPAGKGVSGEFTMPDLGAAPRSVTVRAHVTEDGDRDTPKRRIQFLGPAAVPSPAAAVAPAPPAAPAAPAASLPPAPTPTSTPAVAPARAPSSAVKRQSASRPGGRKRHSPDRARKRRSTDAASPRRATLRRAQRRHRRQSGGARVRKRGVLHDAPLFRGVPESPAADTGGAGVGGDPGLLSLNAIAPPTVRLASASAAATGDWPTTAAAVPLALGAVALLLLATVIGRRHRLASRDSAAVRRGPGEGS